MYGGKSKEPCETTAYTVREALSARAAGITIQLDNHEEAVMIGADALGLVIRRRSYILLRTPKLKTDQSFIGNVVEELQSAQDRNWSAVTFDRFERSTSVAKFIYL